MRTENTASQQPQHIAFYGSLMKDHKIHARLVASHQLAPAGTCQIKGELYDLGDYPGMVAGNNAVFGELYKIVDPEVFKALDKYEEFDPSNFSGSLFVRKIAKLKHPDMDCWVYFYNGAVTGKAKIASGDWNEHLKRQGRKP